MCAAVLDGRCVVKKSAAAGETDENGPGIPSNSSLKDLNLVYRAMSYRRPSSPNSLSCSHSSSLASAFVFHKHRASAQLPPRQCTCLLLLLKTAFSKTSPLHVYVPHCTPRAVSPDAHPFPYLAAAPSPAPSSCIPSTRRRCVVIERTNERTNELRWRSRLPFHADGL